jgi:tetratricopeptide (TPR) repeat protein
MLQAVILCLMNYDYCFMKRVSGVLIFVMLVMTACSSAQEAPAQMAVESEPVPAETVATEVPTDDLPPTNPDVMYHVFSAEVLGAEGDVAGAAGAYLEAALISDDPKIAERAAKVAVSAGEWQMVALASDRWAMLDAGSLDARELAAGSRLKEGDYVGAEFQLIQILNLTKAEPAMGWVIVTALLGPASDQVRANKVMENLLDKFDARLNVDALIARSQMAARLGELDKASEFSNRAIEQAPQRADLLAWSGRLAVNMGDETLALKRYRQAWQLDADDPQIAMSYAELLKRNQDKKAAQEVLAQVPDTPDMRFARIVFALDVDDRENAEILYTGFSKAGYEDKSSAAFQAAQGAELLGHKREAVDWYQQVTGKQSLRAIMRQAFLLAGLGDVEQARNLLVQLRIQADSNVRSQGYLAEAQILQDAGMREEALQLLNDALIALPGDVQLRYTRALLAVGLGQLELAENDLRQIISVEPDNAAAINALGYTLADLTERYDEAEQFIRRAYELQPEDASIIDSMGWISYRLGRLREAEAYMREAWKVMRNAEIAAHLGEVLWARGQKDEARSLWNLGLEMESENEVLINTMQRFGEAP